IEIDPIDMKLRHVSESVRTQIRVVSGNEGGRKSSGGVQSGSYSLGQDSNRRGGSGRVFDSLGSGSEDNVTSSSSSTRVDITPDNSSQANITGKRHAYLLSCGSIMGGPARVVSGGGYRNFSFRASIPIGCSADLPRPNGDY